MEAYCANCGHDRCVTVVDRQETYPVREDPVTVTAKVAVCQGCHQDISVASLDDHNLQMAFNQYRERHGLFTADEIVRLRERYRLSQRGLADLLGWGAVTIQQYETGGIQNVAHDQILRSLSDPEEALRYLRLPICRLSSSQAERLRRTIGSGKSHPAIS